MRCNDKENALTLYVCYAMIKEGAIYDKFFRQIY